jgi:hypothetical protein
VKVSIRENFYSRVLFPSLLGINGHRKRKIIPKNVGRCGSTLDQKTEHGSSLHFLLVAEEFQACSPTAQVSGLSSGEPPTHQEYSIGLWHREEINFF